jgi:5,10-methylenetetrahydromethanopterin reductase
MFESGIFLLTDIPLASIVEAAVAADEEGMEYVFLADWGAGCRDVFTCMAAIAAKTKRIKMGPGITNPYLRHPIISATAVATIDEMSGGRAFLAFGLGGEWAVLQPLGAHIEKPLRIMRETLDVVRGYYSGQPVNYNGEFMHINGAAAPWVRKDIPIYYAARGSQSLKLGGELSDGLLITHVAKFDLPRNYGSFMDGAHAAGRKPKVFYCANVAYRPEMLDSMRTDYAFVIMANPESVQQRLLTPEQIKETKEDVAANGLNCSAVHMTNEVLSNFVIVGDEDQCAAEIAGLMGEHPFDVFAPIMFGSHGLAPVVHKYAEIVRKAQAVSV